MNKIKTEITFGRLMKVIRIGGERTHRPFSILCSEQDKPVKLKTWDISIAMSVKVGDHVLVVQNEIIKLFENNNMMVLK